MLLTRYSYGLKRYMDDSMIQKDGTVVFDIQVPSSEPKSR